MYHRQRNLPFFHEKHMDRRFQHIAPHHEWQYGFFEVTKIHESIQGSLGSMPTIRKRKALHQCLTSLWYWMGPHSMAHKVLPQGRCKPISLTCKLLQGNKIDHKNNIGVESSNGNIMLDCCIKAQNGSAAGVKFLCETSQVMAQSTTAHKQKNINDLHIEFGHPSEVIIHATVKSMGIQVTGTYKQCDDCTLGKAKKGRICKKAVACSKLLGERLFFNISSLNSYLWR